MEEECSTSASTIRTLHYHLAEMSRQRLNSVSLASSPRSSALPSPPDSPSSGSVSSLPSVSSSFFFSSGAASPHHSHSQSELGRDLTQGLIIPSLTLPEALRRPTPFGQTIGDLKLLVLGSMSARQSFLAGLLLEDNDEVVEVGSWEDGEFGKMLRASTDWVEHRDAHGLEKIEPTRNIEIIELPGYDYDSDGSELLPRLKAIVQNPFHALSNVLHPHQPPSPIVAGLLSSASTPLYTALIFLLPSAPTPLERRIIETLSPHIPIVALPALRDHEDVSFDNLSSFQPSSTHALRTGLFHSPETLALLRSEATDRFLRWREVERVIHDINKPRQHADALGYSDGISSWDKAKWESEWLSTFSHDVANRLQEEGTSTSKYSCKETGIGNKLQCSPCINHLTFDPLHFPSLIIFSVSLIGPIRSQVGRSITGFLKSLGDVHIRIALVGGFCVGLGLGLFLK